MAQCANCRNCYKPKDQKEACLADLWDRNEDDFLQDGDDFFEYIHKVRFCSDYSKNEAL